MNDTKNFAGRQVRYQEVSVYDDNGELIYMTQRRVVPKNGSGFVLSYTSAMTDFIEKCSVGATVRVFVYLSHRQAYGNDGVFGLRTTRGSLAKTLSLSRKTIYSALEYLKSNRMVSEVRVDGCFEYMVNPDFVTIGTDRKGRQREWQRRMVFYDQQLLAKGGGGVAAGGATAKPPQ